MKIKHTSETILKLNGKEVQCLRDVLGQVSASHPEIYKMFDMLDNMPSVDSSNCNLRGLTGRILYERY